MFRPTQRYNIVATLFRMVTTLFQYCNDVKVKNDHRSKFSNLSNWKEEAWKKSGLQRDSNPWPPRYRCVALPTELWSHTLGARSIEFISPVRSEMMWSIYEIMSPLFFISRSSSLSLFSPLSFDGLPPTFSFSLYFSFFFFFCLSLYSKIVNMTINLSLILWQHGCRNNFRSRLYWLFSCLCFTRRGWVCDFKPK